MRIDPFELMRFEKFLDSLYSNRSLMVQNILNYIKHNPNLLPKEIVDTIHTDSIDSIIEDKCDQCQKINDAYDKGMDDGYTDGQMDGKAEGVELTLDYLYKVVKKEIEIDNSILQLLENMNVYDLI